MDFKATVLTSGDLEITLWDATDHDELAEMVEDGKSDQAWHEGFEHYSCNGSYTPFDAGDANPFVGLTSAPCIAEIMNTDDDGEREIEGAFWYFNMYQIVDYVEEMLREGRVVFTLAQ